MTLEELIVELESLGLHPTTEVMVYDYSDGELMVIDGVRTEDEQVVIF